MESMDGGADRPPSPTRHHGPRLYHKKSRAGCLRCKARRVKCDEKRPSCGSCSRHGVECTYLNPNGGEVSRALKHLRCLKRSPAAQSIPMPAPNSTSPPDFNSLPSMAESTPTAISPSTGTSTSAHTNASHSPSAAGSAPRTPGDVFVSIEQHTAAAQQPLPLPSPADLQRADDPLELPESRERRLTELALLHHYLLTQSQTFGRPHVIPDGGTRDFNWTVDTIKMAFEEDCILHAVLATSALNKWLRLPRGNAAERADYRRLQQQYLALAMQGQRRCIETLSAANAEHVCIASLLILSHSFALVQTLGAPDEDEQAPAAAGDDDDEPGIPPPWEPPTDWLQMGRGAGQVFTVARGYLLAELADDRVARFLDSRPQFDPDVIFTAENREGLLWLLDAPSSSAAATTTRSSGPPDREVADKVTRDCYHRALSYVGWTERALRRGDEPLFCAVRRFVAFSIFVPHVWWDFLVQRRPRAMVVLAYFFGLLVPFEDVWVVGPVGRRQVAGIYRALRPEWREKLDPMIKELGLVV